MRAPSVLLLLAVAVAVSAALVRAHDTPAAFMDPRDDATAAALEKVRRLAADARDAGVFGAATLRGSDDCTKCRDTAATVFGLIATDPALVAGILEGVLCKDRTTAAEASSTSSCKDVVKDIVDELSVLANKAIHGGFHLPQVLCNDILRKCSVPCCETPTTPEQVHLSIPTTRANEGYMAVSWATLEPTELSVVQYWPAFLDPHESTTALGTNFTYTHGGWIGVLHSATMSGLANDTMYAYRVGASHDGPWSPVYNFTTFPTVIGTPARPLRAIQIADMGCGENAKPTIAAIAERVARREVDVVFHPGDIGYDDGDEHVWDVFMRAIEPIAARVPYMTAPGNHELLWNFSAYKRRFPAMPSALPRTVGHFDDVAMFYELNIGPFSVFMLDSESVIDTAEITPMQSAWFADAAMAAAAANRPILTMTHRPMYCSSGASNCEEMAAFVREGIESTLNRAKVLLHTTGHLHEYERTLPINASGEAANAFASNATYVNPTAPTYIVNGAAGNPAGQNSFKTIRPWSVAHSLAVGYNVWSLSAGTDGGHVSIASAFVDSVSGHTIDAFTITRD